MDALAIHLASIGASRQLTPDDEARLGKDLVAARHARRLLGIHRLLPSDTVRRPGWVRAETLEWTASLIAPVRRGGAARDPLIESCQCWAMTLATRRHRIRGHDIDMLDLLSWAHVGLLEGVDTFDYRKGRLTTNVFYHIQRYLLGPAEKEATTIRYPRDQKLPDGTIRRACVPNHVRRRVLSLDERINRAPIRKAQTRADMLVDHHAHDPFEAIDREDLIASVKQAMDHVLSQRLKTILLRRANRDTLDEIGRDLGITRERIRQLEQQAKRKLLQHIRRCTTR